MACCRCNRTGVAGAVTVLRGEMSALIVYQVSWELGAKTPVLIPRRIGASHVFSLLDAIGDCE